jgi:outer membrane receptor for ferrienterochelin and colicin
MKHFFYIALLFVSYTGISQKTNEVKIIVENNSCINCNCDFLNNNVVVLTQKTNLNGIIKVSDSIYNSFTDLKIDLGNGAYCNIQKNTNQTNYIYTCTANHIDLKSNTLQEVAVYAKKNIIEDEGDKLVYNVDKEIVKTAISASDLLKRTPMVSLDVNGSPSIRGNSSVLIMVNNKLVNGLLPSQVLEQIPSNEISKIEVITAPGAKYEAEGTAGIINIITKKKINFKSSGYLNVGLGSAGSHLFSNYIYALNNKWTISNYLNSLIYYTKSEGYQSYTNQNAVFNKTSNGKSQGQLYGYQLSVSRNTDKDKLNFNFNYYGQKDNLYENYTTNLASTPYQTDIIEHYSFFKFMTDYENKLSDTYKINVAGSLSHLPLKNQAVVNTLTFDTNSSINNATFSIDLEAKFSRKFKTDLGVKTNYNFYKSATTNYSFDAKQSLFALYTDNKWKISNTINFNFGLRFEGYSLNSEKSIAIKYNNVFPSSSLSIKLNNKTSLSFLYGQRTQRPAYTNLLPIQSFSSSNQVTTGNPELNQEISNNYEVSFSSHLGDNFIKISPFYKYIKNKISNYTINNNTAFYTNYINLNAQKDLGVSLWFTLNLFKQKLSFNYGVDIIHKNLTFENINKQGVQALNSLNITYKITPTLYCNLFGNFNTPNIYLQGKENAYTYSNCSLQKEFNKGNIRLVASVDNPFSRGFKYTQNYNFDNANYTNEVTYLSRGIRLLFIYKFGNKDTSKDTNKNPDNILKQESIN